MKSVFIPCIRPYCWALLNRQREKKKTTANDEKGRVERVARSTPWLFPSEPVWNCSVIAVTLSEEKQHKECSQLFFALRERSTPGLFVRGNGF